MRILHVLDHSLPLQSGYSFRTRAILKAQEASGHVVAGVTGPRQALDGDQALDGGQVSDGDQVAGNDRAQVDGLTFYRTPFAARPGLIGEAAGLASFARGIVGAVKAFRPDVLHAHSPVLGAMAAMVVARRRHLPLVYEIRAFWEDAAVGNGTGSERSWRYRATRALETWVVRRAGAVAVICQGLRDDLVGRGINPGKIIVSPNGVDLTLFGNPPPRDQALAIKLGLTDGDIVGFIGSFYDYEGLDDLIAAMPALIAARPRARLLLVGGGPMEGSLREQATASPVAGAIRFIGRVPHDEVERYYGLIDVLAYPRKRMRLTDLVTPLKPLEAMAQGRLVAASDVGGHRELIESGETGKLFGADDPAAIAAALSALFNDRQHWPCMRERARSFVAAERNWSLNISRYDPVYRRLVETAQKDRSWSRLRQPI